MRTVRIAGRNLADPDVAVVNFAAMILEGERKLIRMRRNRSALSKIVGRNINNLRYADDATLMAAREEELKSLLMKVKEESEKTGVKLNIQK